MNSTTLASVRKLKDGTTGVYLWQPAYAARQTETILGRRRMIPDINSPIQARRQFGQRAAMNSVIQGSAADLIKLAMVNLHRQLKARNEKSGAGVPPSGAGVPAANPAPAKLLIQIHDELVLECRQDHIEQIAALVRHEMKHAMTLKAPLKVEVSWGQNWLEGK